MVQAGVLLSEDCAYRLKDWRIWGEEPPAVFVRLMPKIREELPGRGSVEVTRCCEIALSLKAGGAVMVYLFPWRGWNFKDLRNSEEDPVGPEGDSAILDVVREAKHAVCVWGPSGSYRGRDQAVLALLRSAGVKLQAAGFRGGSLKGPGRVGQPVELIAV